MGVRCVVVFYIIFKTNIVFFILLINAILLLINFIQKWIFFKLLHIIIILNTIQSLSFFYQKVWKKKWLCFVFAIKCVHFPKKVLILIIKLHVCVSCGIRIVNTSRAEARFRLALVILLSKWRPNEFELLQKW